MIGILGGMGPRATLNFIEKVIESTSAKKDWEHVHLLVDFDVTVPSRGRCIMLGEESPVNAIKTACRRLLEAGASSIFVPCNSAHYFYNDVVELGDIPWVDMISLAREKTKGFDQVLVLGGAVTITTNLYGRDMENAVYLSNDENEIVYALIENIKLGESCEKNYQSLLQILDNTKVNCILLACTELPLAIKESSIGKAKVVDAGQIYTEELIRRGGKIVKTK